MVKLVINPTYYINIFRRIIYMQNTGCLGLGPAWSGNNQLSPTVSGLRKIKSNDIPCSHSEHYPPTMIVLENGEYEYTCPACGRTTTFTVNRPTL